MNVLKQKFYFAAAIELLPSGLLLINRQKNKRN